MKNYFILFSFLCFYISFVLAQDDDDEAALVEGANHKQAKEPVNPMNNKRYKQEIAAGDLADLFSTNIHKAIPINYPEFSRRFVPVYPYTEKSPDEIDEDAERRLDRAIRQAIQKSASRNKDIVPVLAPSDLVLAVAKEALRAQNENQPADSEEFNEKEGLRSGNYWNSYWKEEGPDENDPALRSKTALKSVRVKVVPGSKLYELISMTRDHSPRLLYVINSRVEK